MHDSDLQEDSETLPLVGMRVLDLTRGALSAVSRHYAELGADVIRIDPDGGAADRHVGRMIGETSLDFLAANLGKRSATPAQLDRLAIDADMLIAPLGALDVSALRAANPTLVVMSISDFGETGRFTNWAGSEAVHYALSGQLSRSGIPDREPLLPPDDLGFACAAAQAAFYGLVAYLQALESGIGDHLDYAVLDGITQVLDPGYGIGGSAAVGVAASQLPRGRADVRFRYPILRCSDGFVRLCVLAPRQWQGLFEWMGSPEEFADPSFNNTQVRFSSSTLLPAIGRFFADKSRAEIEEGGIRFGVPVAAVLDYAEALETEHLQARCAFVPVPIAPGLTAPFPNGVLEIDGVRAGIAGPVPDLPRNDVAWRSRQRPNTGPSRSAARPLAGIRVLDFGVIVVGAESGRLLGDQGADVIKIESSASPDGARASLTGVPMSAGFAAGSRNKRSLGVDLRKPEGKDLILRLVRDSDVLIANFKGGTLEAFGFDYASLKAINPRIIVCDSSAYGASGPAFRRMGYGPLVRAGTGLTMQWRYPGEPESFSDAMTIYPDHAAARVGMLGVVAMLIRRRRTGLGGSVCLSQSEIMLSHVAADVARDVLERAGHTVENKRPHSAVYRCAGDDEWCVVTLRNDHDRQALSGVTSGVPLGEWLATQAPQDAMERLQAAGVPAGAMLRVSDLPDFDYFVERKAFRTDRHQALEGPFLVDATTVRAERLPVAPLNPAPMPCEHTVAIAGHELGLDVETIARLLADGVLEAAAG